MDDEQQVVYKKLHLEAKERFGSVVSKYNDIGTNSALCQQCIANYKAKHGARMWPVCFLSSDLQIVSAEQNGIDKVLSPDDWHIYSNTKDPILWAKAMFDWDAREYQEEMMRCSSRLVAVRAGRRLGKTEALAVLCLHAAWTRNGKPAGSPFDVLIICPYDNQVSLIFRRLRSFIDKSEAMETSVTRDVANPNRIEFANGSSIMGVTAGVRTGAKADQARGLDADFLVIDECDFLDEGSLTSTLAILSSNPECRLWASSTPTGKRQSFFNWCTHKELGFREFHYRSETSPSWSPFIENFYRSTMSKSAYEREFGAEFGDSDQGVFKAADIETSIHDYELGYGTRDSKSLYSMGVDWNSSGTGTHIIVTKYDTTASKFIVVDKHIIDSADYTQHLAVQKVLDVQSKWKCDCIYVDSGFGSMQIEALREYGRQFPGTNIDKIVVPVQFGSKTEIRDPVTKELVKKPTKPLVVDIATRRLEIGVCVFPKSEDYPSGLIKQMRDYQVIRYGVNGQPVYSEQNDHTLVAWMLSVFGLVMEFSDLSTARIGKTHQIVLDKVAQQSIARQIAVKTGRSISGLPEDPFDNVVERTKVKNRTGIISRSIPPVSRTMPGTNRKIF